MVRCQLSVVLCFLVFVSLVFDLGCSILALSIAGHRTWQVGPNQSPKAQDRFNYGQLTTDTAFPMSPLEVLQLVGYSIGAVLPSLDGRFS